MQKENIEDVARARHFYLDKFIEGTIRIFFQLRIFQHFKYFFIHTAVQDVCYTKLYQVNLIMADYALSDKA